MSSKRRQGIGEGSPGGLRYDIYVTLPEPAGWRAGVVCGQTSLSFALPERMRLLEDQRVDLAVEALSVTGGTLRVAANGVDIQNLFVGPKSGDEQDSADAPREQATAGV
jgi:hypothetical protein